MKRIVFIVCVFIFTLINMSAFVFNITTTPDLYWKILFKESVSTLPIYVSMLNSTVSNQVFSTLASQSWKEGINLSVIPLCEMEKRGRLDRYLRDFAKSGGLELLQKNLTECVPILEKDKVDVSVLKLILQRISDIQSDIAKEPDQRSDIYVPPIREE